MISLTLIIILCCFRIFYHRKYVKIIEWLSQKTHWLARKVFGGQHGFLREQPEPQCAEEDSASLPKTYVGQHEVPSKLVKHIGFTVWLILMAGWMVFWDIFLIDTSYACDTAYDCYLNNGSFFDLPVQNCLRIANSDKAKVTCYTFVFKLSSAVGIVGGFIAVSKSIMMLVSSFWLTRYTKVQEMIVRDKEAGRKLRRQTYFFQVSSVIVWIIVSFVIPLAVGIVVGFFPNINEVLTYVQSLVVVLSVVAALSAPWQLASGVQQETDYQVECEKQSEHCEQELDRDEFEYQTKENDKQTLV